MGHEEATQDKLTPGLRVYNRSGEEGVFTGYVDRDGTQYGRFEFGDLRSLLPIEIIHSKISFLPPAESRPPTLRDHLQRIIDNPETYYVPGGFKMSKAREEEMTQVIERARRIKALFRGDDRHPFFPVEKDGVRIMPPFVDGFRQYDGTIGGGIYTTPDISYAFDYPEPFSHKGFVYIISPRTILDTIDEFEFDSEMRTGEIRSGDIPASDVYAAIGHKGNEITDIQINPSFGENDQVEAGAKG